jgi:hypothetical protein
MIVQLLRFVRGKQEKLERKWSWYILRYNVRIYCDRLRTTREDT